MEKMAQSTGWKGTIEMNLLLLCDKWMIFDGGEYQIHLTHFHRFVGTQMENSLTVKMASTKYGAGNFNSSKI